MSSKNKPMELDTNDIFAGKTNLNISDEDLANIELEQTENNVIHNPDISGEEFANMYELRTHND